MATKLEIEKILNKEFNPVMLEVVDDSSAHRGHSKALHHEAAGHFKVIMKSERFNGLPQIKRHRLVYEQLAALMDEKIHALSMDLKATDESDK